MSTTECVNAVVIGHFMGLREGRPLVVYAGNLSDAATIARSTVDLGNFAIGTEVAIVFEDGNPERPLVIGRILSPDRSTRPTISNDAGRTTIVAAETIELRVGKASLLMHADGRITLRGTTVVSQASGANRIRGGSVHLN